MANVEDVEDAVAVISAKGVTITQLCTIRIERRLPTEIWKIIFNWLKYLGLPTLDEALKKAFEAYLRNESWGRSKIYCIRKGCYYSQIFAVSPPNLNSVKIGRKGDPEAKFSITAVGPTALKKLRGPPSRKMGTPPGLIMDKPITNSDKLNGFARVCDALVRCHKDGTHVKCQNDVQLPVLELNPYIVKTCVEYRKRLWKEAKAIEERIDGKRRRTLNDE